MSSSFFARHLVGLRPLFNRQLASCTRSPASSSILLNARSSFTRNMTTDMGSVTRAVHQQSSLPFWLTAAGVAGVGLGVSALTKPKIHCDASTASSGYPVTGEPLPPPPQSSINVYELSFGTVCGICAGIFIKKGAKALAFLLGGAFVLLQYLGQSSVLRVDWSKMATRFENLFYTKDPLTGSKKAPNVYSLWNWVVDFLTANFQQRASFVAGLALGLRVG